MNFGSAHGVRASEFPPGKRMYVKIAHVWIPCTVVAHNGRHSVRVRLDTPYLQRTVEVRKNLFGNKRIISEKDNWIVQPMVGEYELFEKIPDAFPPQFGE